MKSINLLLLLYFTDFYNIRVGRDHIRLANFTKIVQEKCLELKKSKAIGVTGL